MSNVRSLFYISAKRENGDEIFLKHDSNYNKMPIIFTTLFDDAQIESVRYIKKVFTRIKKNRYWTMNSHFIGLFEDLILDSVKIHEIVIEHKGEE